MICANRTINNPYHFLGPTELQAEEAGHESTRNILPHNIDTGFIQFTHTPYNSSDVDDDDTILIHDDTNADLTPDIIPIFNNIRHMSEINIFLNRERVNFTNNHPFIRQPDLHPLTSLTIATLHES